MARSGSALASLLLIVSGACSSSSSGSSADAGTVDGPSAPCGAPGDQGNAKGVGHYCTQLSDCPSMAPLCSILGDPKTHFCTYRCTRAPDAGSGASDAAGDDAATGGAPFPTDCGDGATCACDPTGQNCGCTPNHCL